MSADNWDDNSFVKKSEPTILNPGRTNEKLIQYQFKAMQTINSLAENNGLSGLEISDLVNAINMSCFNKTANPNDTICGYLDKLIAQFTEAYKFGTAQTYKDCKRFVERRSRADLKFSGLTNSLLNKMETAHLGKLPK